jgi:hypothetical protein
MSMSRSPRRPVRALLVLALSAAFLPAQANHGIIFSEIVHGPSIPPVGGVAWPSYIELVNIQIANPVSPPPTLIGSPTLGMATLTARVGGLAPITLTLPLGQLGGNLQPSPPAAPNPNPPTDPPVLVIASSANFPPGTLPSNVVPIVVSAFFQGPNSLLGAPGVPFELCFNNPATGLGDRIHLGPPTGPPCSALPFNNTQTFQPMNGHAGRWCYVDSNTDLDFDANLMLSPGNVNPQMCHVNGLFFGTTSSPALGGAPLAINGSTSGTLSFGPNARVKAIHFMTAPSVIPAFSRTITNPAFDGLINAPATLMANFTAQPSTTPGQPPFLPGLTILNESLTITTASPAGTGILGLPSNLSTQVGANIGTSYTSPTDIRPERIFTDMVTDAAPFVMGSPTAAAVDVIPPSTGGGNVWCEIIVYDYAGNEYRAKVKNWPNGMCMGPLVGLGTDGAGSFTLMNLCFSPNSMVANLFSNSPIPTCGGPLLPPGGICPDAYTSWILTPPQLGSLPFFTTVDGGGVYLFQVPTGTLTSLIGFTFDAIGVQYTPTGIVQQSGVTSITL